MPNIKYGSKIHEGIENISVPLADGSGDAVFSYGGNGGSISGAEDIEQLIDESGVLDSTDGTITEKIEQLIEYMETFYQAVGITFGYNGSQVKRVVLNCKNMRYMSKAFYNCNKLTEIYLTNTQNVSAWDSTFNGSAAITTIETLDMSSADKDIIKSGNYNWINAPNLTNLKFVPQTIKNSITFLWCSKLTDESIQSIIDGLATVQTTQNLTLHADVKAKLTEAQLTSITNKNWTLV